MLLKGLLITSVAFRFALSLQCYECSNAPTNEDCLREGKLTTCTEDEAVCEDQVRHEDGRKFTFINKHCKQKLACSTNVQQNLRPASPIQCALNSPTSICTCCCDTDGCNRNLLACWNGYPEFNETQYPEVCQKLDTPANSNMQRLGNYEPGTTSSFRCIAGFFLVGEEKLTCLSNYTWNYPLPECRKKFCKPNVLKPKNGFVTCSHHDYITSRCRFKCRRGFGLVGSKYLDCADTNHPKQGMWTAKMPYCKPLYCDRQGPMNHGGFRCTNRRKVGSVCQFQCPPEYEIFPHGYSDNVCKDDGQWNRPYPCCNLPCPPYAVVDFVIVLDSSSSVREDNWVKMKEFVNFMLQAFTLRPDSAQFAAFRYNKVVDTETQILLSSYPKSSDRFFEAFNSIPYNGEGTYTGNALDHVVNVILKDGNRPEAQDVVLLMTDGISQDDVAFPARVLRRTGAMVLVLPIKPPGEGKLDLDEIETIAGEGNENNILREAIEGGFDALTKDFARRLGAYLCPSVCANPFHDHPGETPEHLKSYAKNHPLH